MKKNTKLSKLDRRTSSKRLGLLIVKSGVRAGTRKAKRESSPNILDRVQGNLEQTV